MSAKSSDDQYSESETIARREAALKRLLSTPPKLQKEMVGQPKDHLGKATGRAKTKAT